MEEDEHRHRVGLKSEGREVLGRLDREVLPFYGRRNILCSLRLGRQLEKIERDSSNVQRRQRTFYDAFLPYGICADGN